MKGFALRKTRKRVISTFVSNSNLSLSALCWQVTRFWWVSLRNLQELQSVYKLPAGEDGLPISCRVKVLSRFKICWLKLHSRKIEMVSAPFCNNYSNRAKTSKALCEFPIRCWWRELSGLTSLELMKCWMWHDNKIP